MWAQVQVVWDHEENDPCDGEEESDINEDAAYLSPIPKCGRFYPSDLS